MYDDQPANVVSRHATTDGEVVYARGDDGRLQVWLHRSDRRPKLVTRGAQAEHQPVGGVDTL